MHIQKIWLAKSVEFWGFLHISIYLSLSFALAFSLSLFVFFSGCLISYFAMDPFKF